MHPTPCRDCGMPIVLWRAPSGQYRRFGTTPIPWRAGAPGIVAARSVGWLDAQTAWPEPSEMLPAHRCPAYERDQALEAVGDLWGEWLDSQAIPGWVRTA